MNTQKISQYFFILAAVISILDGAFTLDANMTSFKVIFLLISGALVGILRHDQNEKEFIIAGIAVIFTGLIFTQIIGSYELLSSFAAMIENFIIFLSTAVIVVGIEVISEIIAVPSDKKKNNLHLKNIEHLTEEEIKTLTFQKIWGTVILVAVALTFILLLTEAFFDVSKFSDLFMVLNGVITTLFIADLFILYNDSKNFHDFIKHNVFDILASIPSFGVFRALKIFRAVKIVKVLKGTSKLTKISKTAKGYKTTKFFSDKSYFNKVNEGTLIPEDKKKGLKSKKQSKSKKPLKHKTKVKSLSVKKKTVKKVTGKKKVTKKKTSKKTVKKPSKQKIKKKK